MAKKILTGVLIVLLYVFVGCREIDSGASQLIPPRIKTTPVVKPVEAGEADIVEQMTINRQAYRNALKSLTNYYSETGNNMKLRWAKDELKQFDGIPQYKYIIEAIVAPENLRATTSINEADYMYREALRIEKKAGLLILIKHEDNLRTALDTYNQIIKRHPSSDKIDDAAFRAAGIYEYFRDYTIAVLYYKRAFQWDPETTSPARFKAAYILDKYLHRRDEALELYRQALAEEKLSSSRKDFIKTRIAELTKSN